MRSGSSAPPQISGLVSLVHLLHPVWSPLRHQHSSRHQPVLWIQSPCRQIQSECRFACDHCSVDCPLMTVAWPRRLRLPVQDIQRHRMRCVRQHRKVCIYRGGRDPHVDVAVQPNGYVWCRWKAARWDVKCITGLLLDLVGPPLFRRLDHPKPFDAMVVHRPVKLLHHTDQSRLPVYGTFHEL